MFLFAGQGSGAQSGDGPGLGTEDVDVPYSTLTARDVVDKFLSIVDQYEQNRDNCTPGVEFSLGEGVVSQYGVKRFKGQCVCEGVKRFKGQCV